MRRADRIESIIRDFCVRNKSGTKTTVELDKKIINDALLAQEELKKSESAAPQPKIWRTIMKSKMTKFATAAAIILIVVFGITFVNKLSPPAWAIEQSIEAMDGYKAVLFEGLQSERTWRENGSLELKRYKSWAVANEDQTMVEKFRIEVEDFLILTTNGQKTWRYDPGTNTVCVENRPYVASECWFGGRFLEQLKEARNKWKLAKWEVTYGKNPATGKERAFLIFSMPEGPPSPRSLSLEFDMESKLLVSLKQWENAKWEGPATLVVERITYYESLPEDLFEFEIPEGAKVIEE